MDFRDPNTVGTFLYHCHLLEHEDGGMMGLIRVEPADGVTTFKGKVPSSSF
jgi:FtsP/CotA-like multicopper oxidase with cupredoxin domain